MLCNGITWSAVRNGISTRWGQDIEITLLVPARQASAVLRSLRVFSVDPITGECYEIPEGTAARYRIFSIWCGFEGHYALLERPTFG